MYIFHITLDNPTKRESSRKDTHQHNIHISTRPGIEVISNSIKIPTISWPHPQRCVYDDVRTQINSD